MVVGLGVIVDDSLDVEFKRKQPTYSPAGIKGMARGKRTIILKIAGLVLLVWALAGAMKFIGVGHPVTTQHAGLTLNSV